MSSFQVQTQGEAPWSTGLCDCCDDVGNCCLTWFCPCVTFGRIAEIIDRGSTSCATSGCIYTLLLCATGHCVWIYACYYRKKMRSQYALAASPCNDCLVHCFCGHCALCQEYRELKLRGFNMEIGWEGNMEKQGRGQAVLAPDVQRGMTR